MASQSLVRQEGLSAEIKDAASRGWCLHPLRAHGKEPLLKAWQRIATSDTDTLSAWAAHFVDCNWGIATGRRSSMFVVDVDEEVGKTSLLKLEKQWHRLPETITVTTGWGKHLYFRMPSHGDVRNSAGMIAPGLDIRGTGGYVVSPPSVHPNGVPYRFEVPSAPIADSPDWLLGLVLSQPTASTSGLLEGFRNDGLARSAGRLRRRGFTREQIAASLHRENSRRCHPPLPASEVDCIAASIAKYPPAGPDVLDQSWEVVQSQEHSSNRAKFRAIVSQLATLLPKQPIALPLERIAGHLGCNWTLIRRYRQELKDEGILSVVECAIPHRKAGRFVVIDREQE